MHIFKTAKDLTSYLNTLRRDSPNVTIGFVPTMGALHEGHISLINSSVAGNDITICSIFVNPAQFGDSADLEKYPKPIESDIALLLEHNCSILFLPDYDQVYPPGYDQICFNIDELDLKIEGASRPGHFQGVCNVLAQFFKIVNPTRAYFGQKDYQQTVVVKRLVQLLDLPLEVVVVPIKREPHGLAMSSRNIRLSEKGRQNAAFIYKSISNAKEEIENGVNIAEAIDKAKQFINAQKGACVDYLLAVDTTTLEEKNDWGNNAELAILTVVEYEGVRLLDNIIVHRTN